MKGHTMSEETKGKKESEDKTKTPDKTEKTEKADKTAAPESAEKNTTKPKPVKLNRNAAIEVAQKALRKAELPFTSVRVSPLEIVVTKAGDLSKGRTLGNYAEALVQDGLFDPSDAKSLDDVAKAVPLVVLNEVTQTTMTFSRKSL